MDKKGKWYIWSDKYRSVLCDDDCVMEFTSEESARKALESMPEEIRANGFPHPAPLIYFDELDPKVKNYDGYVYNKEIDSYVEESEEKEYVE